VVQFKQGLRTFAEAEDACETMLEQLTKYFGFGAPPALAGGY
jgi:hypothetical protein